MAENNSIGKIHIKSGHIGTEEAIFGFLLFDFSTLIIYWINDIKANCFEGNNVQNLHFLPGPSLCLNKCPFSGMKDP